MALPNRRADCTRREPPRDVDDWRTRYEIENAHDIDAYVAEHPTVATILREAPDEISDVFGDAGVPKLSLSRDPEKGDHWLSINIPVDVADETAVALIDDLEDRWWLDRMQSTDAVVAIDVVER